MKKLIIASVLLGLAAALPAAAEHSRVAEKNTAPQHRKYCRPIRLSHKYHPFIIFTQMVHNPSHPMHNAGYRISHTRETNIRNVFSTGSFHITAVQPLIQRNRQNRM